MSSIDPTLSSPLTPHYTTNNTLKADEAPAAKSLISTLNLTAHIEGGYFLETDRDPTRVPNPFLSSSSPGPHQRHQRPSSKAADLDAEASDKTRNACTSIHYLLTPTSPLGAFHRNKGRTIHTLHRGRGRYVVVHADEVMPFYDAHECQQGQGGGVEKARVETFVVGLAVERGERIQWIVEGGKYKASYLLEDLDDDGNKGQGGGEGGSSGGLLISETVVPGFEYGDHDFMREDRLDALVTKEQADELRWMLRKDDDAPK
ncbi:hypothetical protein AAFC00_006350 [Neodothiora populina]|uniref:DUF985 domain-containing protein n=1 Tax=Neodothiora populina TaxID=2781224 RepID=A0ABR3P549_9PEZI